MRSFKIDVEHCESCGARMRLRSKRDWASSRDQMERAAALAEGAPSTELAALATRAWVGRWPEVRDAFERWAYSLDPNNAWMLWRHRGRLVALFRELRRQGHFDEVVALLQSVRSRRWWSPWADAALAAKQGRAPEVLEDARARKLHGLLSAC